jgi:hypothetical protein
MDILNWTRNHRELPDETLRWWTTTVLLLWMDGDQWKRHPEDLSTLLKWGAGPSVLYTSSEVTNKTVPCGIQDAAELEILVSRGFNKFDHKDSGGDTPLSHSLRNVNQCCCKCVLSHEVVQRRVVYMSQ